MFLLEWLFWYEQENQITIFMTNLLTFEYYESEHIVFTYYLMINLIYILYLLKMYWRCKCLNNISYSKRCMRKVACKWQIIWDILFYFISYVRKVFIYPYMHENHLMKTVSVVMWSYRVVAFMRMLTRSELNK